jgi:hypothetical protein
MSNKELCLQLINGFEEEQLKNIVVMLKSVKDLIIAAEEEAYCLQLLEDYENDPDPKKDELMSIQDFSKQLGIELRGQVYK